MEDNIGIFVIEVRWLSAFVTIIFMLAVFLKSLLRPSIKLYLSTGSISFGCNFSKTTCGSCL